MNNCSSSVTPLTEALWDRFLRLCREYRHCIFSCLSVGLLCYLFTFTNKLVNHDELDALFGAHNGTGFGRWGLYLAASLLGRFSMPWFLGAMTLVFMTLACCLIVKIFSIRSPLQQMLLSGLIIAFPSLTANFSYMFLSGAYAIAFVLSIAAVYLAQKKGFPALLAAAGCLALCLSIYQAYLTVCSSLLLVCMLRDTLYSDKSLREIFREGLRYLLLLAVSVAVYGLLSALFLMQQNTGLGSYAVQAFGEAAGLGQRIKDLLYFILFTLFEQRNRIVPTGLSACLHMVCIFCVGCEMLLPCCRKDRRSRLPMLLLLVILLILSIFSMVLVFTFSAVHTLVMYSFIAVYVLFAVVMEGGRRIPSDSRTRSRLRALGMDLTVLALGGILFINCILANEASLKMHLSYERSYSFATALTAQMQMTPGYGADTPVAFLGTFPDPARTDREFPRISGLTGTAGIATDSWSYEKFFPYYLGVEVRLAEPAQADRIRETPEFAEMPLYPAAGSLRMIDGILAVKFAD